MRYDEDDLSDGVGCADPGGRSALKPAAKLRTVRVVVAERNAAGIPSRFDVIVLGVHVTSFKRKRNAERYAAAARQENAMIRCPRCSTEKARRPSEAFLGRLGRLLHFQCRTCGSGFNLRVLPRREARP